MEAGVVNESDALFNMNNFIHVDRVNITQSHNT